MVASQLTPLAFLGNLKTFLADNVLVLCNKCFALVGCAIFDIMFAVIDRYSKFDAFMARLAVVPLSYWSIVGGRDVRFAASMVFVHFVPLLFELVRVCAPLVPQLLFKLVDLAVGLR